MDGEEWQGLTVRACNGRVVGVVVGVFAEGPFAGRLRVHGEVTDRRHPAWLWTDTLVFAIPRHAVVRRTRRSLVLNVALAAARANWLMHTLQRGVAY
jgi:hypothetical protein